MGPIGDRRKDKLRGTFARAAKQIALQRSLSVFAQTRHNTQNLLDEFTAASPVPSALSPKPQERDEASLFEALDWWLASLPASGLELAPELNAPRSVLLEVFRRGKYSTCVKNQVVQEEGEEVRHYTIILTGSCRLRCGSVAVPSHRARDRGDRDRDRDEDAGSEVEDTSVNNAGHVTCDVLNRGEAFGLLPGDPRACYGVVCTDKASLLRLKAEDYDATLKPFHKEYFARVAEFLRRSRLCSEGTAWQFVRLAPFFRHRRAPRGAIVVRAGETQRHVWFLQSGSCSVLVHEKDEHYGKVGSAIEDNNREEAAVAAEIAHYHRLVALRAASYGARVQQTAAYEEQRRTAVKGLARGPLKQTLAGVPRNTFQTSQQSLQGCASLSEPGIVLGEEIFIYENFSQWIHSRYGYTVRAVEECTFYVIDIANFRHLAALIASDRLTQVVSTKLSTRSGRLHRGQAVSQSLTWRAQRLHDREATKEHWQQLRLPQCALYEGSGYLEDLDDWLPVVMEHRRAPRDDTNLPTLTCLEGTPYGPGSTQNGPGVAAMLKVAGEARRGIAEGENHTVLELKVAAAAATYQAVNPLGRIVSSHVRYDEARPPSAFLAERAATSTPALEGVALPQALEDEQEPPSLFFHTEVGICEGSDPQDRSLVEVQDRPSSQHRGLEVSTSLPNLGSSSAALRPWRAGASSTATGVVELLGADPSPPPKGTLSKGAAAAASQRQLLKTFQKVMPGKSVLVLTDKLALRRVITTVLFQQSQDVTLVFVRTAIELFQTLRRPKEHFHALLLDLTKNDLQVEPLLRTVKEPGTKHEHVPIVVLSAEPELPEAVRHSCNFVVILPISAAMLREALVWCFDRKQSRTSTEEEGELRKLDGLGSPQVHLLKGARCL